MIKREPEPPDFRDDLQPQFEHGHYDLSGCGARLKKSPSHRAHSRPQRQSCTTDNDESRSMN